LTGLEGIVALGGFVVGAFLTDRCWMRYGNMKQGPVTRGDRAFCVIEIGDRDACVLALALLEEELDQHEEVEPGEPE
jgi:hypothetical protein